MAEAYKGLTIRIGADVSNMKRELEASNAAIRKTQKQLNKLNKAAKLDPGDLGVFSARMEAMADKAQAVTARLAVLKKNTAMADLAGDTQNAALKAEYALREYSALCDQIKRLKNEAAMSVKIDPFANGGKNDPFKNIKGIKETLAEMKKLGISETYQKEYENLAKLHKKAQESLDFSKAVREVAEYKNELAVAEAEAKQLYAELARLAAQNPMVTQTASFAKFRSEMTLAEADVKELKQSISALDRALDLEPANIDAARLKMEAMADQVMANVRQMNLLNEQMDEFRKKGIDGSVAGVKDLRAELSRVNSEVAETNALFDKAQDKVLQLASTPGLDRRKKEWRDATREANLYSEKLDEVRRKQDALASAAKYRGLSTEMASLASASTNLVKQMQDAGDSANITRGALQQLGWSLYSTLTPAFMILASSAIQSAEDIDTAYRNMRKTVSGTEAQFEELKQAALDFSRTHFTSADQILEIEAMGGQLGVATSKLESFAETVSNLEIATNLDADTAAEQLGQLSAILNDMTQDDFSKFGDALVRLGNNNATLEDKIMDVTLRIASMGTITGFSATELLAWATAVAATGQGAESSGTAISKTMSDIETAVGKGGDSLKAFADVAGMTSERFAELWGSDPSSAMQAFIQGLKDIESNGGSADSALGQLGITSVRQKQAILGLMQTIGGLNDNLAMAQNAWDGVSDEWGEAGDAAREAERKAEGFSGAIQILRNNFQALSSEMGEQLAPAVTALGEFTATLTQAYSEAPDFSKNLVNMGIAAGAFAGPALVGFNAVRTAWGDMVKGMEAKRSAWAKSVENSKGLTGELEKMVLAAGGVVDSNGKMVKSYDQLNRSQKIAARGAMLVSGAMKAIPGAIALIAVTELAGQLYDYVKEAEAAREATEGMGEAMASMSADYAASASRILDAKKTLSEISDATSETIQDQAELAASMKETWESIGTDSALADRYVDTIARLGVKSVLTAKEQTELATAVAGLNELTGQSYEILNAITGELSASTSEIKANTEAWKKNARYMAAQEELQEIYRQQLNDQRQLEEVQGRLAEAREKENKHREYGTNLLSKYTWEVMDLENQEKKLEESLEAAAEAEKFLTDEMEKSQDATSDMAETVEEASATVSESVQTLIEELSEELGSDGAFSRLFNESGLTVEQLAWKMDQAGISASDLASACETACQRTANAFDKVEEVEDVSLQSMIDNLTHNIEVTRNWKDNLAKLYSEAGDSTRPFIDYMASLGPEYAPIVQALVDDTSGMLSELAALFNEANIVGSESAIVATLGGTADAIATEYEKAATAAGDAIKSSIPYTKEQMEAWSKALYDSAYNEGYNPLKEMYEEYDKALWDWFYGEGEQSAAKVASDFMAASYEAASQFDIYGKMYQLGNLGSSGYMDGMMDGIRSAQSTISPSGVSMQADIANGFAASKAASQSVSNSTVSTVNNYISIDGAQVNSDPAIEAKFYDVMMDLERISHMEGGR